MSPSLDEFPPTVQPRFLDIPLNGGRVQSISVSPLSASAIIAATEFGGLWRTEDAGSSWRHLDDLTAVSAMDVCIGGNDDTVIATLARDTRTANGGGIWVSRDGGWSWARPASATPPFTPRVGQRISGHGIAAAPDDPRRFYVGTDFGVAVSEDEGATWIHRQLDATVPVDDERLQDAAFSVVALPDDNAMALSRSGAYRTDDGGESWERVRDGDLAFRLGFKSIDVSPVDPDKVFVLASYNELLLYERAADVWTSIPLPGGSSRGPFVRITRSSAAASRFDIWAGTGVALRRATCADIGAAKRLTAAGWTSLARAEGLHCDTGHLGVDAAGNPVLYGSDGGFFRPVGGDPGRWNSAPGAQGGLNSYLITDLAGTVVREGNGPMQQLFLYFATQDNAIWASSDGGRTWPASDCTEGFHIETREETTPAAAASTRVAYGRTGCNPGGARFSDAGLRNQRPVPSVSESGTALTDMGEAFRLPGENWVRYRQPAGADREVWVSTNGGANWRRIATFPFEVRGVPMAGGSAADPAVYIPVRGTLTTADGRERVGLIRLRGVVGGRDRAYTGADVLYLPSDGSLGVRATMFDWHAVLGVDPVDGLRIIAPDIHNNVVRVSTDGGRSWVDDRNLTREVTQGGRLLFYDGDAYHMQVTQISFDPFDREHVLVGTRDGGVARSTDRGATWRQVEGSERIPYVTGFAFRPDGRVHVSSYGRGLWTMDFRYLLRPFPHVRWCKGLGCIIRFPPDPRTIIDRVDWAKHVVLVVLDGRVTQLDVSGGHVRRLGISPGARTLRYAPQKARRAEIDIDVVKAVTDSPAFGKDEVINAVVLDGTTAVGMITSARPWTDADIPDVEARPSSKAGKPTRAERSKVAAHRPYAIISTPEPRPGLPVVVESREIHVSVRNLPTGRAGGKAIQVAIDGTPAKHGLKLAPTGSAQGRLRLPDGLSYGEHNLTITQHTRTDDVTTRSRFVTAPADPGD